jgi:transcriptional regulator with XRE-family HTH domain
MRSLHTVEYNAFLKKLIAARKYAKLSQAEVAKFLCKPQSFISKCESGERRVDIVELKKFAEIYKKGLKYFVE